MSRSLTAAIAVASFALLFGCESNSAPDSSNEEAGVAFGASKAEFQAALADMEPVELTMQANIPATNPQAGRETEFAESLDEWSGGKIKIKLGWSESYVPTLEIGKALGDGRLDIGQPVLQYEPEIYPVTDQLLQLTTLSEVSPLASVLHPGGWATEMMLGNKDFQAEFERNGFVPLVAIPGTVGMFCSKEISSIDDFKGKVIVAGTKMAAELITAVGASPTSLPFTDYYEALQRGVADCVMTGTEGATVSGILEVAPFVLTPSASGALNHPVLVEAISARVWKDLPLAAQQLIFDRASHYLPTGFEGTLEMITGMPEQVAKHDGKISFFDDQTTTKFEAVARDFQDRVRSSKALSDGDGFVAQAEKSAAEWSSTLTDDLGLDLGVDLAGLPDWLKSNELDLAKYAEKLNEARSKYRPK